jgi:hypothetical protein
MILVPHLSPPRLSPPSCVFESNLPLLRRLIEAGAGANSADYDGRTPLHIAAAEGNGVIVKVLVEEGGARLDMRDRWAHGPPGEHGVAHRVDMECSRGAASAVWDARGIVLHVSVTCPSLCPCRWGNTPADEARRVGDLPVSEFLEARARQEAEAAATTAASGLGAAVPGSAPGQRGSNDAPAAGAVGVPGSAVAAANAAARGAGAANGGGRATVDVGAAVQQVLTSANESPAGSLGGSTDDGSPGRNVAPPNGGGAAAPAAPSGSGRLRPPLEPVHKAVAVGHAWSVVMPRAAPMGNVAARAGSAGRPGGAGRGGGAKGGK